MSNPGLIVYGTGCVWWDWIENCGKTPAISVRGIDGREYPRHSLPCCPHCGGVLYQIDPETWFGKADRYEYEGRDGDGPHPGYRAMLEWQRGKCFPTLESVAAAYLKETGISVRV